MPKFVFKHKGKPVKDSHFIAHIATNKEELDKIIYKKRKTIIDWLNFGIYLYNLGLVDESLGNLKSAIFCYKISANLYCYHSIVRLLHIFYKNKNEKMVNKYLNQLNYIYKNLDVLIKNGDKEKLKKLKEMLER